MHLYSNFLEVSRKKISPVRRISAIDRARVKIWAGLFDLVQSLTYASPWPHNTIRVDSLVIRYKRIFAPIVMMGKV